MNYPSEQADTIGLILWLVAGLVVVLYLCANGDQREAEQPCDYADELRGDNNGR